MTWTRRQSVQDLLSSEGIIPEVIIKAVQAQTKGMDPDKVQKEVLTHMAYLAERPGWSPAKIGTRVTVLDLLFGHLQARNGDPTQRDLYGYARDIIIGYVANDGDFLRYGTPINGRVARTFARVRQILER